MYATSSQLGAFFGGIIAILLSSLLWEWLLRSRIRRTVPRHLVAVVLAWLTAGVLGGFGFARSGTFTMIAFPKYLLPAVVVGVLFYLRARGRDQRK